MEGAADVETTLVTPEQWREARRLFHEALARARPERAGFLRDSCGNDVGLLDEVTTLLAADERAHDGRFLRDIIGSVAHDLAARDPR